jgi:flagellar protein FliO/FliZ
MAGVSVGALIGRMVVSLGLVIALMWLVAKFARKRMGAASRRSADPLRLQVLARQSVGKNASVTLVRSGDRALLLGVTDHTVSLLSDSELPPEPAPAEDPAVAPSPSWDLLLRRARDLTVRRV